MLGRLRGIAAQAGIEMAELCIRYLIGIHEVSSVLMGVETVPQLRKNIEYFAKGALPLDVMTAVMSLDTDLPDRILNPWSWSRRMPDVVPGKLPARSR